mmetsp:Transcript_8927/g.12941  ORF Transcript_8927/g.12941 Transcript_8927/m.12941 type:complete len:213 (+) Transcript_8927:1793-2431(+)
MGTTILSIPYLDIIGYRSSSSSSIYTNPPTDTLSNTNTEEAPLPAVSEEDVRTRRLARLQQQQQQQQNTTTATAATAMDITTTTTPEKKKNPPVVASSAPMEIEDSMTPNPSVKKKPLSSKRMKKKENLLKKLLQITILPQTAPGCVAIALEEEEDDDENNDDNAEIIQSVINVDEDDEVVFDVADFSAKNIISQNQIVDDIKYTGDEFSLF